MGRLPKDIDYQGRLGSQDTGPVINPTLVRLLLVLIIVVCAGVGYFLNTPL